MKTAIQELIEWFHNRPEYDKTSEGYEIMEKAKELLEKEKEQIKETFDNGVYVGTYAVDKDGEQYYNQTYNQNP